MVPLTSVWGISSQRGVGPQGIDSKAIRASLGKERSSAHEVLELDPGALQARKPAPLALDRSGIAKGSAVDRMVAALIHFGITSALAGVDGEIRA